MSEIQVVQVRCARCAWAATGVSEDASRSYGWLEDELAVHLERAHALVDGEAQKQAQGVVQQARGELTG